MTALVRPLSLVTNPMQVNILNERVVEASDRDAGTEPNAQGSRGV